MDFTRYAVDDFLLDESFQAYVADADSEAGRFWRAWLSEHPSQQAQAARAHALVQGLRRARPLVLPAGLEDREFERLQRAIHQPQVRPRLRSQRRARRLVLGTLFLFLLAVGLGRWQWLRLATPAGGATRYATGAGQQRTVVLPDGSVVVLNANSSLTVAAQWNAQTPREVWLTGEGFFKVAHRARGPVADIAGAPANIKFVVHAEELSVAVLGTQFDVRTQPGNTKVVLTAGKIAVERRSWIGRESLLMQPGDLVETSASQPRLAKRQVPAALYLAWTKGYFEFHDTPVRDIAQLLRDTYGLQVTVTDPAILQQVVSGAVAVTKSEFLLPALAESLDLKVTRIGNTVRFEYAH